GFTGQGGLHPLVGGQLGHAQEVIGLAEWVVLYADETEGKAVALNRVLPAQTGKLFPNRGDGVQHVLLARAADSEFRAMRRLTADSDSRVTLGELLHGGLRRFRILKGNPLISLTNS